MRGTKDNPEDFRILERKLNLPQQISIPRGTRKKNKALYFKLKAQQKSIAEERLKILKPYKAGTYKEWEGDGYFNSSLFLYEGVYYG